MTVVPADYELEPGQFINPILWIQPTPYVGSTLEVETDDEVMDGFLGPGNGNAIKSFGHDPVTGVHFLLTRKGTAVHTDKAYLRYSHQLVLRNDGNRIRGLERYDSSHPKGWHIPMVPGVLYCLDTHSPHQGTADLRFGRRDQHRAIKAVIAVDRSVPLDPDEALTLCESYLTKQFADFPFDPTKPFAKWKEPKSV